MELPRTDSVAPGVHRLNLPLPFELKQINTYLVKLDEGWLLIDAGIDTPECLEAVRASLDELGVTWPQVRKLLLTHFHPDHMGLAPRLLELTRAELLMHECDVEQLEDLVGKGHRWVWIEQLYAEAGIPEELRERIRASARAIDKNFRPLAPNQRLHGGEKIGTQIGPLDVVWTPGHSPGHVCLHSRERRLLFSGDHMLETITPNISWFPEHDTLGEFLESLETIARLDVDLILPSHGQPFRGHTEWIRQTQRHHDERCRLILETISDGPKTAYELIGALWQKALSAFNVRFALFEVLAHLEYMRRRGRVVPQRQDTLVRWAAT